MKKIAVTALILLLRISLSNAQKEIDPSVFLQIEDQGKIELTEDRSLNITVTEQILNEKPISSLLPGYLFEMGYGDMESGMWSEMLFNRQFEPFPPYKESRDWWYGLRQRDSGGFTGLTTTDWREMHWYHNGYDHNVWYAAPGNVNDYDIHEQSTLFQLTSNKSPVKITRHKVGGVSGQWAHISNLSTDQSGGLAQNGKYLRKGMSYTFTGYFKKGDTAAENIKIALYQEGKWSEPIIEAPVTNLTNEWVKKTVNLKNLEFEGFATFAVMLPPGVFVDIDAFSLMPDDNINGWRKDVIEMVRDDIKPGVLRWPGGCFASYYRWNDGIGPKDQRPVRPSPHWGGFSYNDVGTLEYLDFCEKTASEPFICLNLFNPHKEEYEYFDPPVRQKHSFSYPDIVDLDKGAKLAADWVAYCNLPVGKHPMADLRAKHGRPEPYNVRYWELENEAFRWFQTPQNYAEACIVYAKAMKAADPTIKLGLCTYGSKLSTNVEEMLSIAGDHIDFLADRGPTKSNLDNKLSIIREWNKKHNDSISYANTEYFINFDQQTEEFLEELRADENKRNLIHASWGYALNWANLLMQWQRYGGDVIFTNFNSFVNDHFHSVFDTPKEGAFLRYPAVFGKLFRESESCWLLQLDGYEPDTRKGLQPQVAWNRDKTKLIVYIYNANDKESTVTFNLGKLNRPFNRVTGKYIIGPGPVTYRTVKNPVPMVKVKKVETELSLKNNRWTTVAPPHSFVEFELSVNSNLSYQISKVKGNHEEIIN